MADVEIKWRELDAFVLDVRKTRKARVKDVVHGINEAMKILDAETQKHLTGGNPLFRGTGKLASSVRASPVRVVGTGQDKTYKSEFGVVGFAKTQDKKGPGFYGRVLEWGAQTPGHMVYPKKPGGRLVFRSRWKMGKMRKGSTDLLGMGGYRLRRAVKHGQATGHVVFATKVKMSPKPWLTPSFEKMRPKMIKMIEFYGGKVVDDLAR